jgi:hypothetical protein
MASQEKGKQKMGRFFPGDPKNAIRRDICGPISLDSFGKSPYTPTHENAGGRLNFI